MTRTRWSGPTWRFTSTGIWRVGFPNERSCSSSWVVRPRIPECAFLDRRASPRANMCCSISTPDRMAACTRRMPLWESSRWWTVMPREDLSSAHPRYTTSSFSRALPEARRAASRAGEPLIAVPTEYSRKKQGASGFTLEYTFMGSGVRWMEADSGQSVSYYVNPNSSPVSGGAAAEIARAMDAWPNQSGASIHLQTAGQTANCGIVIDNVNTISFGDCLGQLDPPIGNCSGVVALTAINYSNESSVVGGIRFNRLVEADTVFNRGMNCFLANSANLAEVTCHELGHSIGLGHSGDTAAIMWPSAHGN